MSRLRRLVVSNRFFFITCRMLPHRGRLSEEEFELLARVVRERRQKYHFLLTAWEMVSGTFCWRCGGKEAGEKKKVPDTISLPTRG